MKHCSLFGVMVEFVVINEATGYKLHPRSCQLHHRRRCCPRRFPRRRGRRRHHLCCRCRRRPLCSISVDAASVDF